MSEKSIFGNLVYTHLSQSDWEQTDEMAPDYIKNKPDDLATKSYVKAYVNTSTTTQSDWGQTDESASDYIKNKPTDLATTSYIDTKVPAFASEDEGKVLTVTDGATTWKSVGSSSGGSVQIDDTLTQSGQAADAKVTGDEFSDVRNLIESIGREVVAETTLITIPSGWMHGDLDHDGLITKNDVEMLRDYFQDPENVTLDENQLLAADVNGDGEVSVSDLSWLRGIQNGTKKYGVGGNDIAGNWFVNENYATEEAQFYTTISVPGLTQTDGGELTLISDGGKGIIINAVAGDDVLTIYATRCPVNPIVAQIKISDTAEKIQITGNLVSTDVIPAFGVTYDNATTGLTSTNVQDAVDRLFTSVQNLSDEATSSTSGLMSSTDKTKLDAYTPQAIIISTSTTDLPEVVDGAILIAYDA